MSLGVDPSAFLLLVLVAGLAGFVDAMAGGGGLLTLPAMLAAGVPPVAALGTNKVQSVFGTSVACLSYARAGHLEFRALRRPAIAALAGSMLGAVVVQRIDPSFLAGAVPVLLVAIAGYFLLSPRLGEADRQRRLGYAAYAVVALAIGFYDGFFGPGTGSFFTASLISILGLGLIRATAATKMLNVGSNLGAILVMAGGGHVVWPLGLGMAAAGMAGGRLGSIAAMRFGGRAIRPLLVAVSLGMTAKLMLDPANPVSRLLRGSVP